MKLGLAVPNVGREVERSSTRYRRDLRRAAIIATDRGSRDAQASVRARMRSAGLGRLGNAVGRTSTKVKGDDGNDPYGVIFARGGDESLAGGALEAYSNGVTIRANQKQWLAFATKAIPRRIGRYRTTPERYNRSPLVALIGKLEFRPLGPNRAVLVIKKVTVSPKTGRAKADLGRRTRTRIKEKEIIAFVLIRETRRARRFDQKYEVFLIATRMPIYLLEEMQRLEQRGGGR